MKFSTAVLILALGGGQRSSDAFILPRLFSTTPLTTTESTSSLAMSAGESIKRGVKFLLVPNAKAPPPQVESIPFDQIPDFTKPAPAPVVVEAPPPPPAPVVVETPPPPPVVEAVASSSPPPPPAAAAAPEIAKASTTTASTISSPTDLFNNLKPLPGMEVDWTEKVGDSYRPNVMDMSAADKVSSPPGLPRWDGSFDVGAWFQDKVSHGWQTSGPVNTGPPKVLETVQANTDLDWDYNWHKMNEAGQAWVTSWNLFRASVLDVTALTSSGASYSQADFERALNLKETSGWYLAVMGTLGVAWWSAAMSSPSDGSTTMAPTAVPRGGMAADDLEKVEDEIAKREALVADQVNQLTQATKAVTQQLAELQSAKARRDYDVATMKSDLRELRNQLDVTQRSEHDLRLSLQRTQDQFSSETQALRKQLEERIQAEAAVQKQLANTKAKLEKELATIAAAKDQAEQQVVKAKSQVKALEQEKQAMEQEIATLQAQVKELQAQLEQDSPKKTSSSGIKGAKAEEAPASPPTAKKQVAAEPIAAEPIAAEPVAATREAPKTAKKSKKAAKKESAVAKKEETPKVVAETKEPTKAAAVPKKEGPKAVDSERSILESLSNAFFANITEPVGSAVYPTANSAGRSKKTVTVKKSPKASLKKKTSPKAVSMPGGDWSSLSASALKRKRVKDLQDYLSQRVPGAKVTGPDGKALKKDDLVEQILSA